MAIQKATLSFLKQLKKNNNKEWFDANRHQYEVAKADFIGFVDEIIKSLCVIDNGIALAQLSAKKCITRINRDIRFNKDKSPYKVNFGAMINQGGKKGLGAGYYVHLESGDCFVAAGIYMPLPQQLALIRSEIDYNLDEFKKIVTSLKFLKNTNCGLQSYDSLKRPPKGYSSENPALPYLQNKGFIAIKNFSEVEAQNANIINQIAKNFEAMQPLVAFLNRALDD